MTKTAPKYHDGRFLKYGWRILIRIGAVRLLDQLGAPGPWIPIAKSPDRNAVYFAHPRIALLAVAARWISDHKWDLDEWAWQHSLMWLADGDYWRNAKWRFPWRHLPSLPQECERIGREMRARYGSPA